MGLESLSVKSGDRCIDKVVKEAENAIKWDYPNRTMCDVLEEMRKANKIRNYSYLSGLIEEVQVMGNRMEAALEEYQTVREWTRTKRELKDELKALIEQAKETKK